MPTSGDTLLLPAGTRLETRGEATAPLATRGLGSRREDEALEVTGDALSPAVRPADFGRIPARPRRPRAARRSAGDTVRLPIRLVRGQRARSRDPGARRRHPGPAQPAGAARDRCAGRPRHHGGHGREPADQPPGHGGLRAARDRAGARRTPRPRHSHPHARPQPARAAARRHGALLRGRDRQHAAPPDRALARVRAPPAHDERGPGGPASATEDVVGRLDCVGGAEPAARAPDRGSGAGAAAEREAPGSEDGESLSFEEAKRAEGVAKSQEELLRQAEALKQSLEALQTSAEAAGMARHARGSGSSRRSASSSIARSRPSCASGWPSCSRRSRTSTPRRPRTRSSDWPRRSRSCARRWSGAASCSGVRRSRAISPT